jgi:branched-chain amino acid transport system permease protein
MFGSSRNLIIAAIVIVALIAIPQTMSSYITYVVALAMLYAMLTASFDLMAGYTGPLSFGHAAFYGIGAYASALLTLKVGMSFWLAFPISVVGVFIFSIIVGYPALKLRGHYFAVTTFFFGHFIYLVLLNSRGLTNGPLGLGGIKPPDDLFGISFASMNANYYLIMFFCVVIVSFLLVLVKSGIGRYFIAIRENEDLAEAIGINTTFYKVLAFGISGAWMTSEMVVIMALVGGTGTIIGPIIGAGVVTFILEFMRFAPEWRFIIWSVMLIVVLLIEPKGLMGITRRLRGGQ